jgi:hypothetical protein
VIATAKVHRHTRVIAHGRVRHHRLTLTFTHLQRGRYSVTVLGLSGHKWVVIGHTSITIT